MALELGAREIVAVASGLPKRRFSRPPRPYSRRTAPLFGFDRYAKLYTDAVRNLGLLDEPDLSHATDTEAAVRMFVEQVEKVFRDEQAQWGQLASEVKPDDAKSA